MNTLVSSVVEIMSDGKDETSLQREDREKQSVLASYRVPMVATSPKADRCKFISANTPGNSDQSTFLDTRKIPNSKSKIIEPQIQSPGDNENERNSCCNEKHMSMHYNGGARSLLKVGFHVFINGRLVANTWIIASWV